MPEPVVWIALCVVIGCLAGAGGALLGVRLGERDTSALAANLRDDQADRTAMRTEWSTTMEKLEELSDVMGRRRRRIAAQDSKPEPVQMTRTEQAQAERAHVRAVLGGRRGTG